LFLDKGSASGAPRQNPNGSLIVPSQCSKGGVFPVGGETLERRKSKMGNLTLSKKKKRDTTVQGKPKGYNYSTCACQTHVPLRKEEKADIKRGKWMKTLFWE